MPAPCGRALPVKRDGGATWGDELAKKLHQQTFLLSELLTRHTPGYEPPPLHRRALMHPHCHHRSVLGTDDEVELLKQMGLTLDQPDTGCCGMAGPFGFEAGDHYRVAMACGERALLPAVRQSAGDTLIVANGFSCQEQIAQATSRRPLHLAQVLQMALREGSHGAPGELPERRYPAVEPATLSPAWQAAGRLSAGVLVGGLLATGVWWGLRRATEQRISSAFQR